MNHTALIDTLLNSAEPSIRWKIKVNVLGQSRDTAEIQTLEAAIKQSPRVQALLQKVDPNGRLQCDKGVYAKWQGAHWVLMTLADIGYPQGDAALYPMADEVLKTWLSKRFFNEFTAEKKSDAYKHKEAIPVMNGRHRTCASQQGNALYSLLRLAIQDKRLHHLAERLRYWQWPDGGWNCDKNPAAQTSTFIHTLYAMRGLALYGQQHDEADSLASAQRAAEFFLKRRLYKRQTNGRVIHHEFIKLHYPLYWHYDILGALKVFAEIGITEDERFTDALDWLEQKALPTGGWPAENRYYKKVTNEFMLNADYVDWGGTSAKRMNEWVTADALFVLKQFGRLTV
ncbi:MAG: hypothetical protein KDE51_27350 [Anaerolineales bacterium]|nr:hypothetical protein [Anaerolineales bacterium]